MYTSSQPHRPSAMASQGGLTSNSSAPASLLTSAVNSAIRGGGDHEFSTVLSDSMRVGFFNTDSSSLALESGSKANISPDVIDPYGGQGKGRFDGATSSSAGLQRSCGLNETVVGDFATCNFRDGGGGGVCTANTVTNAGVPSSSKRNSSSPAGFHKHPLVDNSGPCFSPDGHAPHLGRQSEIFLAVENQGSRFGISVKISFRQSRYEA